jgi:diguanylate cyclase (GGDEF)-like protein/PAS domain S-box-containing protein
MEDRDAHIPTSQGIVRAAVIGGMLVLALLAGLVFVGRTLSEEHDAAIQELGDAIVINERLDETLQLLVDGETAQRGYALTGDRSFLEPLETSRARLPDVLDSLGALLAANDESQLRDDLRAAVSSRIEFTERVVSTMASGDHEGARALVATREGQRSTDRVRALVAQARRDQRRSSDVILARVETARGRAELIFAALALVTAALIAGLTFAIRRDLTRARQALAQSRDEVTRFKTLAESSHDLVRIHARGGAVHFTNEAGATVLGYSPEEMTSLPWSALVPQEDLEQLDAAIERALANAGAETIAHRMRRKDGSLRSFATRVDVVRDEDGRVVRYHTVSRDTTDAAEERERLEALAERDELTGLLNRRAFVARATAMLEGFAKNGKIGGLFFCDVNGLKTVNDTLGHELGDALLRDAAKLLQQTARETDVIARLGGDEFVVFGVVRDAAGGDAFRARLAERIREHNGAAERAYRVSISTGTTIAMPTDSRSLVELLAAADGEMYRAKRVHQESGTSTEILRGEDR